MQEAPAHSLSTSSPSASPRWTRLECLGLVLAVGLALALRLYRLSEQSIWLDEYPSVAYLGAPTALQYVYLIRMLLPEQAQGPLYYLMQYYWAQCLDTQILTLRLLPILLSLTSMPLLYGIGRRCFGPYPAFVALLCMALSPQHIWYGQEIRPYSLLCLLSLLALYALLRALTTPHKGWWILNIIANALLLWVHAFAILALLVQALYLLPRQVRGDRAARYWIFGVILAVLPWAFWMQTMPYSVSNEFQDHFFSIARWANDLIGDELVAQHPDLLPAWKTNPPGLLSPGIRARLSWRPYADALLLALAGAAALYFILSALRKGPHRAWRALFLAWWALPVTILACINALSGRPFMSPMYTLYSSAALFLMIGLLLAWPKKIILRAFLLSLLAGLYTFQLSLLLPEVSRPDWQGAAKVLESEAHENDLILDLEPFWPGNYLPFYWDERFVTPAPKFPAPEIKRIQSLHAAVTETQSWLANADRHSASVWLIYERALLSWLYPDYDLLGELESALNTNGISMQHRDLVGHYNLVLVKMTRSTQEQPAQKARPCPPWTAIDYPALAQDLGLEASAANLEGLREQIAIWPPMSKLFLAQHAFDRLSLGQLEIAAALAHYSLQQYPDFSLGHVASGAVALAQGEDAEGRDHFLEAFRLHPELAIFLEAYLNLFESKTNNAPQVFARLEAIRFLFQPALRRAYEISRTQDRPPKPGAH